MLQHKFLKGNMELHTGYTIRIILQKLKNSTKVVKMNSQKVIKHNKFLHCPLLANSILIISNGLVWAWDMILEILNLVRQMYKQIKWDKFIEFQMHKINKWISNLLISRIKSMCNIILLQYGNVHNANMIMTCLFFKRIMATAKLNWMDKVFAISILIIVTIKMKLSRCLKRS